MTVGVITGAASGIGAGLAREAARRGMTLVLADRDAARLEAVAGSIGPTAIAMPTDVTSEADMAALAERAYAAFGGVDLLFNNAGILQTGLTWEIAADDWRRSLDVNIMGIINGVRAFVPRMLAAGTPARIVNTASIGGFLPSPFMAPYSATKFAVVALTESLAAELKTAGSKIAVSLLAPGPVKSGIFRKPPSAASAPFHAMMTDMLDQNGLDPDTFAALTFDAIGRGEYWIIPQPEMFDDAFRARNSAIADRTPPIFYGIENA